jgi:hypothetical protein
MRSRSSDKILGLLTFAMDLSVVRIFVIAYILAKRGVIY